MSSNKKLLEEIRDSLPDASPAQVEAFASLVIKLYALQVFFQEFPEDKTIYQDLLARARKALNYKDPYRIAVIGITGAGKSTLINAMLGRDLVLTKDIGKPATGAALQIFFDVLDNEQEWAFVDYRKESDIRGLIDEFVGRYNVQGVNLSGGLGLNVADKLVQLQPPSNLTTDQSRSEFQALAQALADLVQQLLNTRNVSLEEKFILSEPRSQEALRSLTDENSDLNQSSSADRRIGLVKSVIYHIKPENNSSEIQTLKLPKNVCLIDLPGLDGTPLHDIIISEGVKEANAVIFILRPPRVLGRGDSYLINRVKDRLGLKQDSAANERIFVVLNAKDSIMRDEQHSAQNLPRDMAELFELLAPNYLSDPRLSRRGGEQAYFMTSAWAAYCAQKRIKGEMISHEETYESIKIKLGVRNATDTQVLEVSQVPRLVQSITQFAREQRVDGQISEARLLLDTIVKQLSDKYSLQKSEITEERGEYYFKEKLFKQLDEQKTKLENTIIHLRTEIVKEERFDELAKQLERQAKGICDEVDQQLCVKMPELWKDYFNEAVDRLVVGQIGKALYEPLLTEAQIFIWKRLNSQLSSMGDTLVNYYQNNLKTYRMIQRIFEGSYQSIALSDIELELKNLVEQMSKTIAEVSRRIAMIRMTDTDTYFTQIENGQYKKTQIFASLSKLPNKQELSVGNFKELVSVLRKDYEPSVTGFCLRGLMNLYRYEMLLIEDKLCNLVREAFEKIRHEDEVSLRLRLQGDAGDPEWQQASLLQRKLAKLKSLTEGTV